MPPKAPPAPLTASQESLISLFSSFSVSALKAEEVARNAKQAALFSSLVESLGGEEAVKAYTWDEEKGKMVLVLIAQGAKLDAEGRVKVLSKIAEGKFARSDMVLGQSRCFFFSFQADTEGRWAGVDSSQGRAVRAGREGRDERKGRDGGNEAQLFPLSSLSCWLTIALLFSCFR